nr:hypothetical protein [Candidatus Krumholzibacteria bacterium]
MLLIFFGLLGALGVAILSAIATYRIPDSMAWEKAYNSHGMGLAIELVFAVLLFAAAMSMGVIMDSAFDFLYLQDGWRSPWYLGFAGTAGAGVLIYMNFFAPGILSREQDVLASETRSQCRWPYLLYTPYSVTLWVALIVPIVAMVITSIRLDHLTMAATIEELQRHCGMVAGLAEDSQAFDLNRLAFFQLEYREAIALVQDIVNRYLWVVGIFMVFLIIMLNTKITTIFTEEAQDSFKYLMWALLLTAMGICGYGLWRFHLMRAMSLDAFTGLLSGLEAGNSLDPFLAVKEEVLVLRNEGTVSFLQRTLEGGSLWLLFFSYAAQIVLAKVTNRSVLKIVFPRSIAKFLESFMLVEEESENP